MRFFRPKAFMHGNGADVDGPVELTSRFVWPALLVYLFGIGNGVALAAHVLLHEIWHGG